MILDIRMAQKIVNLLSRKVRRNIETNKNLILLCSKIKSIIYLLNIFSNVQSQKVQNTMRSMDALRTQLAILGTNLQDTIPK